MSWPLVSVVIPNYNYARYLRQAIDSALQQTYPRVEVVVVDDGSQDDSAAVLASYGAHIKWLRQQNRGVAVARNRGAQASSSDYLAFLDADDYWLPDKLERQMALYRQDPELGLTHCGVEEFDDQKGRINQRRDGLEGWVARELLLLERPVILGGGSGLLMPRALFEEVGGFDEHLSTSADWELFYRLAARRRVGFTPEVGVRYRFHGSNMHGNVAAMERDMLQSYQKVFTTAPEAIRRIHRRCYGNLHLMLAGSFFSAGQHDRFIAHILRGMQFRPAKAVWYLSSFPVRWLRRKAAAVNSGAATLVGES